MNENNQNTNQQISQPQRNPVKVERLKKILTKFMPLYLKIDSKLTGLLPNPKLRKVLILFIVGFIALFILLFIIGIIFSSTRTVVPSGFFLNKPNIVQTNPTPIGFETEIQKQLSVIRNRINDLNFPDPLLNLPLLESGIKVQ